MLAHMLARQLIVTALPCRSLVTRLAVLRPIASSLMAAAPPQRSISQSDCHPPRLEWRVPGFVFSRCSMVARRSPFIAAASATSSVTTGVANSEATLGPELMRATLHPDRAASAALGENRACRFGQDADVQDRPKRSSRRCRYRA